MANVRLFALALSETLLQMGIGNRYIDKTDAQTQTDVNKDTSDQQLTIRLKNLLKNNPEILSVIIARDPTLISMLL